MTDATDGTPIAGAWVSSGLLYGATTGADGKYAFNSLVPGNYSVSVQAAY